MTPDSLIQAGDVCGCDERTGARNLISVQRAIERGLKLVRLVQECETVGLEDAIGRILSQDLVAPFPLPPFDNSAMDGFALRSVDFTGPGPWIFEVAGRVAAGDNAARAGTVGAGQVFRIFTGAAIPSGADAVIMQEHVRRIGDRIEVSDPVVAGSCIRLSGEDAEKGSLLLPAGSLIGPREIGAIASFGLAEVHVRRKLRIALFCTGSELRQPGESLAPGQIYNSNRFILLAALRAPWIDLKDFGAIEDDPARLRDALTAAADEADLIVTTGGVSVGEEDHMVDQLREAGGEIEVMKIAMKPGKPLSVGTLGKAVFVGLPGNPVAAFTTWKIIGSRIAAKLSGQKEAEARSPLVEAAVSSTRRPGRQEYRPARIVGISPDGRPRVEMLDHSYSAKISLICKSDGLAVIPANKERIEAGEPFEFVYL
ncbi:molybdopterin molybdotransferase MoeA [Tateyamaria pelophila]|uniref:molybdopterin molybdotransferase MoeA n=1 Tax=Tateyamaria pelophila TaxID=328415 RepID=UPI001CBB8394|nr:gephyrin-like molybdotransferase Glp [Tateyamaria pelophila]